MPRADCYQVGFCVVAGTECYAGEGESALGLMH